MMNFRSSEYSDRNKKIVDEFTKNEKNLREIGEMFGISYQRVAQILRKYNIIPSRESKNYQFNTKNMQLEDNFSQKLDWYKSEIKKYRLQILNLQNTVNMRDKKIEKLEQKILILKQAKECE